MECDLAGELPDAPAQQRQALQRIHRVHGPLHGQMYVEPRQQLDGLVDDKLELLVFELVDRREKLAQSLAAVRGPL